MEALYYKERKVAQAAGKANGGLTDAPRLKRLDLAPLLGARCDTLIASYKNPKEPVRREAVDREAP